MDRKGIALLVAALALMLSWSWLVNKIYPPSVRPPVPTNAVTSATGVAVSNALPVSPAPVPSLNAPPVVPPPVLSATPGRVLQLENAQVRATITSRGGGLKSVDLKEYPASVGCREGDKALAAEPVSMNQPAFIPAFVHSDSLDLGPNAEFQLSSDPGVIRAQLQLTNGLRVIKEYRISVEL